MNQKIKKFLCKYFLDENRVTIGSILKPIIIRTIIILFFICCFYYSIPIFSDIITNTSRQPNYTITEFLGFVGFSIIVSFAIVLLLFCIYRIISYISNITVIMCEKKE